MKVLLIATVQSHICQFHKPLAAMLHKQGAEVHVAARNNLAEKNGLKLDFADCVFDVPFERSPFSSRNITAYRKLRQIIEAGNYDVIHTNTPVGGIVGRLAARKVRSHGCKVFYTAHGFHFFQGGPKKSWLLYYPIERWMCRFTDELITINEEDFQLAQNKFHVHTSHIHGIGADSHRYSPADEAEMCRLRGELGLSSDCKVLLCVGELNANKNQMTAIHAMPSVVQRVPNAILLLAGNGPMRDALEAEVRALHLEEHIRLLGYRTDLERYVKSADLIVSCSKREGLPVNIIEGMLCEKPVVASINRGHKELIQDGVTGYLVDSGSPSAYASKIIQLLNDRSQSRQMGRKGCILAQNYTDSAVQDELLNIYTRQRETV